jgi:hypothetical protein
MRIDDLFERARQAAFAITGPKNCRVCGCDINLEKRRGRPRLTCTTCSIMSEAAATCAALEATECGQCGVQFAPQRNGVRFCSRKCSHAAYRERRRQSWIAQMCCGCGVPIIGRARKYCTPDCSQQHRTAMRRRAEPPSIRACPECTNFFMPWRAGVMFCSRICSKRRADRNYCARRRAVGREATNRILDVMV